MPFMNQDEQAEKIHRAVQIAEAGLWRFFDEGYTRWPQEKLVSLFSNQHLDHPVIQNHIGALEKQGLVKIFGTKDCYLEVLKVPQ